MDDGHEVGRALQEVLRRAEILDYEVRIRPPNLMQGYWDVTTKARPAMTGPRPARPVIYSGRASSLERACVYALSEWPDPSVGNAARVYTREEAFTDGQ